jgi:diacylglycerol kinase
MISKFKVAFQGLAAAMKHPSVRLQWILAACTVAAGFILALTPMEWVATVICIGLVIAAETVNTCIEKLCDLHTKEWNADVKYIKDISAGAVLTASAAALIAALIILFQHI